MRRILIALGIVVVLAVFGVPGADSWQAERARAAAEAESFALLAAADSLVDLREAVGHLGAVLEVQGGEWVAIRYRDSHAGPGWSSAVARDSGGGWWVSGEHFCGRFVIHLRLKEQGKEGSPDLCAVENAASLEVARSLLMGLGFRAVSPPARLGLP